MRFAGRCVHAFATGVRNGQPVSIPFSRWLQHIGTHVHKTTRTYMLSIPTFLKKGVDGMSPQQDQQLRASLLLIAFTVFVLFIACASVPILIAFLLGSIAGSVLTMYWLLSTSNGES